MTVTDLTCAGSVVHIVATEHDDSHIATTVTMHMGSATTESTADEVYLGECPSGMRPGQAMTPQGTVFVFNDMGSFLRASLHDSGGH